MAAQFTWDKLPSVVIVEILSYLSVTDKTVATSTCRRWRNCLFHPSLWRKVDFKFKYGNRKNARFLTDVVGRFVKEASIEFNSKYYSDVRDCLTLLQEFGRNGNLQKLVLKPISFQVSWPTTEIDRPSQESVKDLYLSAIEEIIQNSRHLRQLSLGCIPELTGHSPTIVQLLARHQRADVKALHVASVKEDPDSYELPDLPCNLLGCFQNLRSLSLDYDYLTNDLLLQFAGGRRTPLERLILHVHGLENDREKITDATWGRVVKGNPALEVTLTLVHSWDGTTNLAELLQPAMPLVHFRMFFCQGFNISGINFLSRFLSSRLESVHIVDGLDGDEPIVYTHFGDEDPFVMLAWKCANLKHFTLIGYDICMEDIIAIARLRGPQLQTFCVPQSCISVVMATEDDPGMEARDAQLVDEVSAILSRPWAPLENEKLPQAVLDPMADAESAYLPILLTDQR